MITMLTHHWLERDLRLSCLFSISLNVDNELDKPEILSLIITLKSTFRRIISINTSAYHGASSNLRFSYYRTLFSAWSNYTSPHPVQAFKSIDRLK
jgi:hypothetical protein